MKTLKDLLSQCQILQGQSLLDSKIKTITQNSKNVVKDTLFIAEKGLSHDGHYFINDAIKAGAIALVVEDPAFVPKNFTGLVAQVDSTRQYIAPLAARFFNHPSDSLFCLGVTGTNGKTSTTYLAESFLNAANIPTGVIGTIDHHIRETTWESQMTTPDPIQLQGRLSDFLHHGAKALAMEVSSHAIDQHRISGIHFDAAIFTNLTRDHLDYHVTMENYFAAKKKLFDLILAKSPKPNRAAFINGDDEWGLQLAKIPSDYPKYLFSQNQNSAAEIKFQIRSISFQGTEFEFRSPWGNAQLFCPLVGTHNIYNVVGTMAACLHHGVQLNLIQSHLPHFKGVPGRLQLVLKKDQSNPNKNVFIDYAHTPDALENVLKSLNELRSKLHSDQKIITVFGCGGDRDHGKRPMMAQIAEAYSDRVIVTSDNPRTEDPLKIIEQIRAGLKKPGYLCIDQRRDAIEKALYLASPNDVVLIAGKGHENYQIFGKEKFYFSDYEIAQELLG